MKTNAAGTHEITYKPQTQMKIVLPTELPHAFRPNVVRVMMFLLFVVPYSALSQNYQPFVEYVLDNGDGTATASFGYLSRVDQVSHIPVGSQNFFSPGVINRGQPTTFFPGRHYNQFQVTFSEDRLFWIISGQSARAERSEAINPQLVFDIAENGSRHFVLENTGNVGIGIATPRERLSVDGLVSTTGGILFPDGTLQTSAGGFGSGTNMFFVGGNVGIGTGSPGSRLHVHHPPVSENQTWGMRLSNSTQAGHHGGFRISNDGFLEVTNNALHADPNFARLNTTGSWTVVSDRRLKRDISPARAVLDVALALNPVFYRFNARPEEEPELGLIAQEVQEVFPHLVTGGELLTLDYARLSVVAIAAIKEQQHEIETLKTTSAEQQDEIESLRKSVADLWELYAGRPKVR